MIRELLAALFVLIAFGAVGLVYYAFITGESKIDAVEAEIIDTLSDDVK